MKQRQFVGVVLSALMVLSVVAVGGAGAAEPNQDLVDVSEGDVVLDTDDEGVWKSNEQLSSGDHDPDAVEIDDSLRDEETEPQDVLIVLEDELTVRDTADRTEVVAQLQSQAEIIQQPVVDELERLQHVSVERQFWITNMVAATIDLEDGDIDELADINGVEAVYRNYEIEQPEPVEIGAADGISTADHGEYTYGLEQINVPEFWDEYGQGEGATIAIMDGGVAEDHPDIDATKAVAIDNEGNVLPDAVSPQYHGTHVASTATGGNASGTHIGVAPEADLYAADIFSEGGRTGAVVGAIEWAVENDADVVSGSIGFGCGGTPNPLHQQALINPIQNANEAGTAVVSSSSNAGDGCVGGYGANFDSFSIGASNADEGIASTSSGSLVDKHVGQPDWPEWKYSTSILPTQSYDNPPADWPRQWIKPDVSAPGVDVYGADVPGGAGYGSGDYMRISGTSMAAPHVAGAIGLLQSATDEPLDDEAIEAALAETATKPDDRDESNARWNISAKDSRYGVGIIDVKAAADLLTGDGMATIEGTVTDTDGEPIAGAEVLTADGMVTGTDENGAYSLAVAADEDVELTVDAFGYAASTQTVSVVGNGESIPADFSLDPTVATEIGTDQPHYAAFDGEFNVTIRATNHENYAASLSDESDLAADDVALALNGDEIGLDETVSVGEGGELALTVSIVGNVSEGDRLGLEHTISGFGDTDVVETRPTELTAEVEPSFIELSNIGGDDTLVIESGSALSTSVEVTNTGQKRGSAEIDWSIASTGISPLEVVYLQPGENTTIEANVIGLEGFFGDGGEVVEQEYESVRSRFMGVPTEVDDTITNDVMLLEPNTQFFAVENASDEVAERGTTVDVDAAVTNLGEFDGTQTVELQVAGETIDSREVSLDSTERTTVTFEDVPMLDDLGRTGYSIVSPDDSAQGELFTLAPNATVHLVDDLPDQEVDTGSDDVSVRITNAGAENVTQTVELEVDGDVVATEDVDVPSTATETVTFEDVDLPEEAGAYEYTVSTDDDSATAWLAAGLALGEYTVTVIEAPGDEFGQATASRFKPHLPPIYDVRVVKAPEMMGAIDETDVFVAQHFYPINRNDPETLTEFIRTVEHDPTTGIVYLEQPMGAEAIRDRSDMIGDPAERRGAVQAAAPVNYTITEAGGDHPIFDGVGDAGDTITVADHPDSDLAWFEGASGETLATVSNDDGTGGPGATVDPVTDAVLVSAIAAAWHVPPENITEEGGMILANAVEHAHDRTSDAGTFVGTVTDEDTGEPVEGAVVRAENGNGDVYTAVSDETGEYRMIGVAPGQYVINPIDAPPGYEPDGLTHVDVGEIVTVDHEVVPMDSVITGTVVDTDGDPIEGAEVVDADGGEFNATTGSDGTFTIRSDAFERGDTVAIRANADGYERSNIEFLDLEDPGANEVGFTLEEPANFDVSIDEDSDVDVIEGDDVVVNVTIENTGDRSATQSIEVDVPGLGSTSRSVPLDGGASTTESFTVGTSQGDAGTYTATASSDDDSDNRSVDVAPAGEAAAHFAVGISGTTAPVTAGEDVSVDLTVENVGAAAGTQDIELEIPDLGSNATTVSLESGASTTRSLSVTTSAGDAGAYNATVSSRNDSADRTVEVDPVAGPFYAVDIVETNEPVDGGSDLNVDVSIENIGDNAGEQPVELEIPAVGSASANVSLAAGESAAESFTIGTSESDTGTHTAIVSSANDSDSTAVTIEESSGGGFAPSPPSPAPDGPEFEISTVDPAVSKLEPGDAFEVEVTVENVGDETGTAGVHLSIDGAEGGAESITLEGGEAATVIFDATAPETAGDVDLTVATADDETTATVTVDDPEETGSSGTDPEETGSGETDPEDTGLGGSDPVDSDDSIPGFGGVVALLGIAVAAAMRGRVSD